MLPYLQALLNPTASSTPPPAAPVTPNAQFFLLDSNHADFSAAQSALLGYTPSGAMGVAAHDMSLYVIYATVTESQVNADAALVDCRQDPEGNFLGTELCRHRWYAAVDFDVSGYHMMGQSEYSTTGIAGAAYCCVKPRKRPSSGTGTAGVWIGYGEKTGKTLYDAADGTNDQSIFTTGKWPAGAALVDICGPHIRNRIFVSTGNNNTDANSFLPMPVGDFSGNPLDFRFDNRCYPGAMNASLQDNDFDGSAGGRVWNQDGTNPNMWSRITANVSNTSNVLYLDPKMSATDIMTKGYLVQVANIATCRATDWSYFKDTGTNILYVNIADGRNPRWRIGGSGLSGGWTLTMDDGATRSKGIRFIHATFIDCGNLAGTKTGEFEWRGCRFIAGSTFRPANGTGPATYVGWSEDGTVPWDTSDLPDPAADTDIQTKIADGSDEATWINKFYRFTRFHATTAGVYESGPGFTDKTGFTIQGIIGTEIGAYADAARHLPSSLFINTDGHHVGLQGQSNMDISFVYGIRTNPAQAGNIMEFYCINDFTSAQNLRNNSVRDFIAVGGGVGLSGAGAYKRTNGTGLLDGNVFTRGLIREGSFFNTWNERPEISYTRFRDCTYCLQGEVNIDMAQNGSEGTDPLYGYMGGGAYYAHHNIYEDWVNYVYYHRQLNWHAALKTVTAITKASPGRVTCTAHGFPDFTTPAAGVHQHPAIYFGTIVGMSELNSAVCQAHWVDANTFDLYDLAGNPIDTSGYGTFVSGGVNRAVVQGWKTHDNTFIKAGVTIASTILRYCASDTSITGLQAKAASQQHLPGCADVNYESNPTINP